MRIGLISDTHVPSAAPEPPLEIIKAFDGVDLILHAGDIYAPSCLDWLENIAPVKAVEYGSLDHFDGDPRVTDRTVLDLDGHKIGMVHDLVLGTLTVELLPGVLISQGLKQGVVSDMVEKFFGQVADIVVFGHTHHSLIEEHDGVLLVNPGSPSLPKQMRRLGQVGILDLWPGGRSARVLDLGQFTL